MPGFRIYTRTWSALCCKCLSHVYVLMIKVGIFSVEFLQIQMFPCHLYQSDDLLTSSQNLAVLRLFKRLCYNTYLLEERTAGVGPSKGCLHPSNPQEPQFPGHMAGWSCPGGWYPRRLSKAHFGSHIRCTCKDRWGLAGNRQGSGMLWL